MFALRVSPAPLTRRLLGVAAVALTVLAWWMVTLGAAEERVVSPVILPSPAEVWASLPSLFRDRALLQSIAATLIGIAAGEGKLALDAPLPFRNWGPGRGPVPDSDPRTRITC